MGRMVRRSCCVDHATGDPATSNNKKKLGSHRAVNWSSKLTRAWPLMSFVRELWLLLPFTSSVPLYLLPSSLCLPASLLTAKKIFFASPSTPSASPSPLISSSARNKNLQRRPRRERQNNSVSSLPAGLTVKLSVEGGADDVGRPWVYFPTRENEDDSRCLPAMPRSERRRAGVLRQSLARTVWRMRLHLVSPPSPWTPLRLEHLLWKLRLAKQAIKQRNLWEFCGNRGQRVNFCFEISVFGQSFQLGRKGAEEEEGGGRGTWH